MHIGLGAAPAVVGDCAYVVEINNSSAICTFQQIANYLSVSHMNSEQASITSFLVKRSHETALPNSRALSHTDRKRLKNNSICEAKNVYEKAYISRRKELLSEHAWLCVGQDPNDLKKYFKCRFCNVAIVARRRADAGRHANSDRHINHMRAINQSTEIEQTSLEHWEVIAAQFLTRCLAYRIPLSIIEKLYDPTMISLATAVYARSKSQRSLTIYARKAGDIMIECIKQHFAGQFITLIADETSIKLQGGQYLLAIAGVALTDASPVLLNIATSTVPFTSDMLQQQLIRTLDRLELPQRMIVGLMADNCSTMKATARKTSLQPFGCIAHTFSLICNALLDTLYPVSTCIAAVHSWLFCNDSIQRRTLFKSFMLEKGCKDVTLQAFSVCKTRWGTYLHTAKFLNKYRVHVMSFVQSQLFSGENATAKSILAFLQDRQCIAGLYASNYFATDLCDAIKLAESDNPNPLRLVRLWDQLLEVISSEWITREEPEQGNEEPDNGQLNEAASLGQLLNLKFDGRFKAAVKSATGMTDYDYKRFRKQMRKACRQMKKKCHHATTTIDAIRHASMFAPIIDGGVSIEDFNQAVAFVEQLKNTSTELEMELDVTSTTHRQFEELQLYFQEICRSARQKALELHPDLLGHAAKLEQKAASLVPSLSQFWKDDEHQQRFHQLLPLVQVLGCIPSSSANVERSFSTVQHHLSKQRLVMTTDTFENELFVSVNHRLLEQYASNGESLLTLAHRVRHRTERRSPRGSENSSSGSITSSGVSAGVCDENATTTQEPVETV